MDMFEEIKDYKDLQILYIENDPNIKNRFCVLLQKLFSNIVTTHSTQEAFELYKNHYFQYKKNFDLIIINHDSASSLILAKEIKDYDKDQVIALISQNKNKYSFNEIVNFGIDKIINYPFENINDTQLSLLELAKKCLLIKESQNRAFLLEQKNRLIDEYIFLTTSDKKGNIQYISKAYLDFTGYTKEDVLEKNHSLFRHHDVHKDVIKDIWQTISSHNTWEGDIKNKKSTGEEYWVHAVISPLYDKAHIIIGFTSILKDITYQKRLENICTLDPLTSLYNRQYFDNYLKEEYKHTVWKKESFALLLVRINNKTLEDDTIRQIAHYLSDLCSFEGSEVFRISQHKFAVVIRNVTDSYIDDLLNNILQNDLLNNLQCSIGGINLDTSKYHLNHDDVFTIADENLYEALKLLPQNSINIGVDEYTIKNIKTIDRFSKLPNNIALDKDLALLRNQAMLIILHINQLNHINDLYGNFVCQELLKSQIKSMKNIIHDEKATLYNLNFQEFAFLITDKELFDKYLLLLQHSLLLPVEPEVTSDENLATINLTAGVAYGVNNLLSHANIALQEALISQKKFKVYKNKQSRKEQKTQKLERLKIYKMALYDGDIIPYFQPIVDTFSGKTIKYEALARIKTKNGEIISPYYFLDAAKEDKTFEYFTRQMMQKVFNIYAENDIEISINIGYENLHSKNMLDYVENRLKKYGGKKITFEILESEEITDYSIVEDFILLVKKYGCKIAIDDFGSGYSSFTNILKMHLDYIKLDGSLITQLNKNENVNNMVKGILKYAQEANIRTIAEFVSTKEIANTVKEFGIDLIQGYYYGEPQDPRYYGLIKV